MNINEIDKRRVRALNRNPQSEGAVVYWMSRDQRVEDNWSLLFGRELALKLRQPLVVVFCLVPGYLDATLRQYDFMLAGLKQVEKKLSALNVGFALALGQPEKEIPRLVKKLGASCIVTDFNPLKKNRQWQEKTVNKLSVPAYEVDAHNIVPCRIVSDKQEFAARTIRPRIQRRLDDFLTEFFEFRKLPYKLKHKLPAVDWNRAVRTLKVDRSVAPVLGFVPGSKEALKVLDRFIRIRLNEYDRKRNDPNQDVVSDLSPYLHFGQISAQRVALEVLSRSTASNQRDSFLEELIIRRELSDNYCLYNLEYDNYDGFPAWARRTLDEHRNDNRHYIYTRDHFEQAQTHDELWNAAQLEMVIGGKMHGYMRMYWAKKILEWSPSPEQAQKTAIYLNDRYELDGRDPNGYTGVAWSIGGVHDRAFGEREIFGKVRYMSRDGCKRKFDIEAYIKKVNNLRR